jgi:hypothetical protein
MTYLNIGTLGKQTITSVTVATGEGLRAQPPFPAVTIQQMMVFFSLARFGAWQKIFQVLFRLPNAKHGS